MDPITHGLTGVVIARAGFSRNLGKWGPVTGAILSLSPDADFVLRLISMETYLRYHRGITHSIILLPLFSLFWAFVLRRFFYRDQKLLPLYLFCFLILAVHIILDLVTSFGTMILTPFSDRRLSWDLVFIIDLYFTGILLIPFLATFFFRNYSRAIAAGSIVLLVSYTGLCMINHNRALSMAYKIVEERELRPSSLAALPQPFTPFKWVLLIDAQERLYQIFVDLNKKENREDKSRVWMKRTDSPWMNKALSLPGVDFFMWFARFPVSIESELPEEGHLVEFIDLRFDILRGRIPFTHRVEFNKDGAVLLEKMTTINSFLENHGGR